MLAQVGKLDRIHLREVWKHEALDFTQWLARDDNILLLGETIELELDDVQTEVRVGQFIVDILAVDDSGRKVVIENQLEPTNHDHLGKMITYAAGLQAAVVVWIVERAREEHEQAIHWLNENTTDNANFFLLQIEAWKIGDSLPAPRFNIIARPNSWAKTVKKDFGTGENRELNIQQQAYFERLREYGESHVHHIKTWRTPRAKLWYNVGIGFSQCHVVLRINSQQKKVSVEIYITDSKDLFHHLLSHKVQIEAEVSSGLVWLERPGKKVSRIVASRQGDFLDSAQTEELIRWQVEKADSFASVFPKFVKQAPFDTNDADTAAFE